jgi:hypothetical protein
MYPQASGDFFQGKDFGPWFTDLEQETREGFALKRTMAGANSPATILEVNARGPRHGPVLILVRPAILSRGNFRLMKRTITVVAALIRLSGVAQAGEGKSCRRRLSCSPAVNSGPIVGNYNAGQKPQSKGLISSIGLERWDGPSPYFSQCTRFSRSTEP